MSWRISFWLAAFIVVLSICLAVFSGKAKKKSKILTPINSLFAGVFIASIIVFLPIYSEFFAGEGGHGFKTFLLSVHNTIRLFIVDGEFSIISESWKDEKTSLLYTGYSVLSAVLFVIAPVLTFGVVLSFFKNIMARIRFLFFYNKEIYVFSELNSRSMTLAQSILNEKGKKGRRIIFTDFYEQNEESSFELAEKAREIGAICFKNDIVSINYNKHSAKSKITFFVIGSDESENIEQSLKLFSDYSDRDNTFLYLFSKKAESEIIFGKADMRKMKLRRVNDIQAMLNYNLYENGMKLFENAVQLPGEKDKTISAVVVGTGDCGMDMLRSLAWFCQMDGYRAEITAIDADPKAESKLKLLCPELVDEKHNNQFTDDGEAQYKIEVKSGVDVSTYEFTEILESLKTITYVFVSLGDDERNIRTAAYIRMICERMGTKPFIQAIIRDTNKKNALSGACNYSNQPYDINYLGDLESIYSVKVMLESEFEYAALQRHIKWGDEDDFWRYEYNRKSSIASAIHRKIKVQCGIAGTDVPTSERKEADKIALRKLEHRRWNAYMRSEGYVYSGSTEKSTRNNLGKMHHCLVTFDKLSLADQQKDDD